MTLLFMYKYKLCPLILTNVENMVCFNDVKRHFQQFFLAISWRPVIIGEKAGVAGEKPCRPLVRKL